MIGADEQRLPAACANLTKLTPHVTEVLDAVAETPAQQSRDHGNRDRRQEVPRRALKTQAPSITRWRRIREAPGHYGIFA